LSHFFSKTIKYLGNIVNNIYLKIKNFFNKILPIFPRWEKIILFVAILFVIVGTAIILNSRYINSTTPVANYGGEYREGIIADSISSVQSVTKKLTKVGLVKYNEKNEIVPDLADRWEITDGEKNYTFYLKDITKAQELIDVLKKEKSTWSDIEMEAVDEHTLRFKLKQPFAPLLANLAEPLFDYGPYKISGESKSEIKLVPREKSSHDKPYISSFIIKLYPDYENLLKALKSKQLDGINYVVAKEDLTSKYNYYEFQLPRYSMLFFNLNSPLWEKKDIRQKLAKGEKIDNPITATLATTDKELNLTEADEIKEKWAPLGVTIDIRVYTTAELQSTIISKRQYDLLIYGLDYSNDPDLYPFWHSSQATEKGLNLANFSNVDADKLLEQARLTNNQEERAKKYAEFQKIFDDQVPAIILKQDIWQYAISNKVKGVITGFTAYAPADQFFAVEKWYIKEKRVKK